MWNLQARLDADTGEALHNALEHITQTMRRSDRALADTNNDPNLIRTATQLRHDALHDIIHTHAANPAQNIHTPAITAIINYDTLHTCKPTNTPTQATPSAKPPTAPSSPATEPNATSATAHSPASSWAPTQPQ